jgi:fermentation-respiration switch protein FrsA (DUF1100 family)
MKTNLKYQSLYQYLIILFIFFCLITLGCTDQTVSKSQDNVQKRSVTFKSQKISMKGDLYLPANYQKGQKLAAVVVVGSWTTVKEQMAGLYAKRLAQKGFAALAFDYRFWGESGGKPRQYESPKNKIKDIINAVRFIRKLSEVDHKRVAGLSICASTGYMAYAIAKGAKIKSFVSVAAWLHDPKSVLLIYGGKKGVKKKISAGIAARKLYKKTGKVKYVPAYSTTNRSAAMFGNFDYYGNPSRGAIPQWKNRFAVMSWPEWLRFKPIKIANKVKVPTLFIHSKKAALPDGLKRFYNKMTGKKKILWLTGQHFDFYDQEPYVTKSITAAVQHFHSTLK